MDNDALDSQNSNKGGRKLIIMAVISIFITLCLTTISLAIYHYSGDIYLDRSRPGYLPDTEEVKTEEDDEEGDYNFEKSGPLTSEVLDEYLEKLQIEVDAVNAYQDPFGAEALSDEYFGIK
ncbi:hypothetical protein J6S55_02155 [Candidatus Saccharibacteria bacterium]|nr:hypothetical protein [Candidatus Saccharibacteria bacterium]